MSRSRKFCLLLLFALLTACAKPVCPPPVCPEPPPPVVCPEPPPAVPEPPVPPPVVKVPQLTAVGWQALEGWALDDPREALAAFRKSCTSVGKRPDWKQVCADAEGLDGQDPLVVRNFFETRFVPYQVNSSEGKDTGLITGYYAPDLQGSRQPDQRFRYPLYAVPDDLLVIDLRSVYPDLANYRLRGRIEGRRVVPYWSRADIDAGKAPVLGNELFWVEDPVELFFLQIQGSGRISTPSGEQVMVGFAEQNGHPYRSIGKLLLDRGAMTRDQMSMQNIKAWARANPDQVAQLLAENPSYVFFRELAPELTTPLGALGVSLTPERSLAVDPRTIPLGAPVFLSTTRPNSEVALQRLMVAQDTGGAIKGAVRADFFWGMGNEAGALAGRMKQQGRLWLLWPRDAPPPEGSLQSSVK